jgi:two-component system nitrate/nitrite response regulator NarL
VRISSSLDESLEAYLRSVNSCIWLIGVERCIATTNELVRRVVTTNPGVKAVILAAYQMPDDVIAALKAGASGFFCQEIPGQRLVKSLELIALGQLVVHPQHSWGPAVARIQASGELGACQLSGHLEPQSRPPIPAIAMERPTESEVGDVVPSLSRREMIILRMLMEGASNKTIALKLVITESTVKVHMKAVLRKLRLQNRFQAAIWARDHVSKEAWTLPRLTASTH